jgi:hypothetical protein
MKDLVSSVGERRRGLQVPFHAFPDPCISSARRTAMLKLYEHPLSPYAQKVKIALEEKNVAFEATIPNLFGSDPAPARAGRCLV